MSTTKDDRKPEHPPSTPSPCSATDIARQWLKKQCEDVNGHISTWPAGTMDRYHHDLGVLIDFVTDCWPNK